MALQPQDTHQAEYRMIGIRRKPYLPYISPILQDREISDKMAKLVKQMIQVLLVWPGEIDWPGG